MKPTLAEGPAAGRGDSRFSADQARTFPGQGGFGESINTLSWDNQS